MIYKQNLHTHSTFCDGKNTPREMIEAAIEMGFDSIGFSGHSCTIPKSSFCMTRESAAAYCQEIPKLKSEYADRIAVFFGLEVDFMCPDDLRGYDYLIGTVHALPLEEDCIAIDRKQDAVADLIQTHFGGDGLAYAESYYKTLARLPEKGRIDILGHADLITKHQDRVCFFDQDSRRYRNAAIGALEALAGKIPYFEVNSGAIARGYRTTPYPAPFLLDELKRLGFGAVITSDCHDSRNLDLWFTESEQLLKAHGFREIFVLTEEGFRPMPLS